MACFLQTTGRTLIFVVNFFSRFDVIIALFFDSVLSVSMWGGESRFVVGERVIISRQDGRGWAVATGYIKCLHDVAVDIIVNK